MWQNSLDCESGTQQTCDRVYSGLCGLSVTPRSAVLTAELSVLKRKGRADGMFLMKNFVI